MPHMGWNQLEREARDSRLLEGLPARARTSISRIATTRRCIAATAATCTIRCPSRPCSNRTTVFGVQFHPEKSGPLGLRIVQKFRRALECWPRRIIPCLDVTGGRVVKGVNFVNLRDAGDPVELAERYNQQGADELVFLDITASSDERDIMADVVARTGREGVHSADRGRRHPLGGRRAHDSDVRRRQGQRQYRGRAPAGADLRTEPRIRSAGGRAGDRRAAQCGGGWNVFTRGGRDDEGIDAVEWAERGEELGAGEILLTSMDTDGVQTGFDCELTRAVSRATHDSGDRFRRRRKAGRFLRVLTEGSADAALAASIFHYGTYRGGSERACSRT